MKGLIFITTRIKMLIGAGCLLLAASSALSAQDTLKVPTELYVQDAYSARLLANAKLIITRKKDFSSQTAVNERIGEFKTDNKGGLVIDLKDNSEYFITTSMPGYYTQIAKLSTAEFSRTKRNRYGISLRPKDCFKISGYVRNLYTHKPLANSALQVADGKDRYELMTDEEGKYIICGECDHVYSITISTEGYKELTGIVELTDPSCEDIEKKLMVVNLSPKPTSRYIALEDINNNNTNTRPSTIPEEHPLSKEEYTKNEVVVLPDFQFKSKTDQLTFDGETELAVLEQLFYDHPDVVVELSVHTDSRKSNRLNLVISRKRAKVIEDFLISRGISRNRFTVVGKGEEVLINRCRDGVRCSDVEHDRNNRVEVSFVRGDS